MVQISEVNFYILYTICHFHSCHCFLSAVPTVLEGSSHLVFIIAILFIYIISIQIHCNNLTLRVHSLSRGAGHGAGIHY